MLSSKKITIFLPSLSGGGAEKAMLYLAKNLYNQGAQVNFFLILNEGAYLKKVPEGISVTSFVPLSKRFRIPQSLLPLIKYFRREKPDVVISTITDCNLIAIIAKIVARTKIKLILSEQNFISLSIKKGVRQKITHFLIKHLYPKADIITGASQGIVDDLSKYGGIPNKKIHVVYNPIIDESCFQRSQEKIDHPFFKEPSDGVLIGAGCLSVSKGYSDLINAFALLKKRKNVRLIILGEGEEREKIEKKLQSLNISQFVSLPGFVDNPYAFMARSNVFVHPALYEGLGNVIVEALACGIPVVATDCPTGPAEVLGRNNAYGKLVPIKNLDALVRAIEEVLNTAFDKNKLIERALDFSVDNSTSKYVEFIKTRL